MSSHRDTGPPRFWVLLARVLMRGEQGPFVREDLEESFARDLDSGIGRGRASRRYTVNFVGSVLSLWIGSLTRMVTHGTALDAKLGIRMLGKQPMLTGVAMLALGLGIPSALGMHHGLSVLVSPLPVPEGDRVMGIRYWDLEGRRSRMGSVHDFSDWRDALTSFESIGAARSYGVNVNTGDPGAAPVRGAQVSASTFEILRSTPLMGRVYGAADEVRGAPDVVILGEDLWSGRFASDPEIVGKTVRVGRSEHTVVGVMPSSFRFPMDDDVWLPLRASPVDYPLGEGPELWVFGRLASGVTKEEAESEIDLVAQRSAADHPEIYERVMGEAVVMPFLFLGTDEFENDPEILLGKAVMMMLLMIVCGNVGLLILARTATRTGEISIRTALGASRGRIITQLFIEALVLAIVATGFGLLVAEAVARWLMRTIEPYGLLPYWMDLTLEPGIVFVALGLAAISAVIAGVLPAIRATSQGVQANLQRTAAGNSTIRFGLGSTLLIVSEVVLSVGFLAMGGTLVRSVFQDTEGLLGFEPERYLQAGVEIPWVDPAEYPDYADESRFVLRLRETQQEVLVRLAADDEVRGVAFGLQMPGAGGAVGRVVLESETGEEEVVPIGVGAANVHIDFFEGLGRPILEGRGFSAGDLESVRGTHRPSVIVNTSFVEQVLAGRSPIGVRFRTATRRPLESEDYDWFEIVGVVGRFGMNPINPMQDAGVYFPMGVGEINPARFMVEVAGDPEAFVPRFREIVGAVDDEATVLTPMSVADVMEAQGNVFRGLFLIQVLLASVAFLLSATGLYALMSFTVSQRTREIGIRTALGARSWSIISTIARRAALQLALGLSLGSVWAWVLLKEVTSDTMVTAVNIPMTIVFTMVGAGVVGIVACASPTLRGLRIQPTEALREF